MKAAAAAGPDAILIPKVFSGQMIITADKMLKDRDAPEKMRLWAIIETPLALSLIDI